MPDNPKLMQLDRQLNLLADEIGALQHELGSTHAETRRRFLREQIGASEAERVELAQLRWSQSLRRALAFTRPGAAGP